jgi:alginate O-acetyltransferase complex protein AlgI
LALGYFKYTNFFAESFANIFGNDYTALNIILPIGISFYSFSAIGYIFDVKRGKIESQGLFDVAVYLSFFPKLTSGPIQRSDDFFKQLQNNRVVGWSSFETGIQIFAFGLFKKLVLADHLSVFVNQVYETPQAFGSLTVFMATVAYSLQIYFDFSGYSDIAIGTARIIGFKLPRNFNLPYLSHNVTEFWKRWHITLSTWLQDYLYISLGGNRKGKIRTYINLIITMLIGGIWHGANWTFIIWGLLHGIALAVHKVYMNIFKTDKKRSSIIGGVISTLFTFVFVSFCWIFFRADSLTDALCIIKRIFSFAVGLEQPYMWLFVALLVLAISSAIAFKKTDLKKSNYKRMNISIVNGYYPLLDLTTIRGLTIFFVFLGLILCLAYTGGSPFIYGNY